MLTPTHCSRICGVVAAGAVLLGALAGAEQSYAGLLPIGGAGFAAGEPDPGLGAHPIFTTGPINFVAPTYLGTLTSAVYDQDPTNPFGLNALTFTYVIHNNASSAHGLHRFTVSSFENFQTDVSYSTLFGGQPPTFVDRSPGIGDVVGFTFLNPIPLPPLSLGLGPIAPGMTSTVLVIQTDARLYQPTLAAVIDGSVTMVESLAPATLIPEPSTWALAAIGMATLLAVRRRRRRV